MTQTLDRPVPSPAEPTRSRVRVGIIGATGYVGGELLRLLARHPFVDVVGLYARNREEEPVATSHPHLSGTRRVITGELPDALFAERPRPNRFFILSSLQRSALAWYSAARDRLERIDKQPAYGISPRNAEQTFALAALLDPEVRLVTLTGPAGTGKTLIALAGALEASRDYRRNFLARPIVPLSNKDLGYLPGDVNSKIDPYM